MSDSGWSAWQPYAGWHPSPEVLAETLDGGQAFRWFRQEESPARPSLGRGRSPEITPIIWRGHWLNHTVQLRFRNGALDWRARTGTSLAGLRHYLGESTDWTVLAEALPWRSDAHLAKCMAAYPGLRLLRQPFGETLLGFLCSATKQIVQIKQMVALLATRHGGASIGTDGTTIHALPTWDVLAAIPEKELRACLLGFRARFISETARFLARHPGWLDETETSPYAVAKERLMELPGVGEKVADCVLLFGAGKLEAFPVDTWVLKSLARRYDLHGWKPAQVAQFGRAHFGALAGLAQQYLFAWERRHGGR